MVAANLTVLLFLDNHTYLENSTGLEYGIGKPTLLSAFKDSCCFVGWGCKYSSSCEFVWM